MYVITWATARSTSGFSPTAASQGMSVVAFHWARAARSVRLASLSDQSSSRVVSDQS